MSEGRLADYLDQMHQAVADACSYVEGLTKDEWAADKRTQQAVIMNLVIVGEVASRVLLHFNEFTQRHAAIPWSNMRGMRNRIAHGYFDIDLDVVWETVQKALPDLLRELANVKRDLDE